MRPLNPVTRTRISIDDKHFELAPDEDLDELKRAVEAAVRTDGSFVDFSVVGGRRISALIGSPCAVFISVEPLTAERRGEGDHVGPVAVDFDY